MNSRPTNKKEQKIRLRILTLLGAALLLLLTGAIFSIYQLQQHHLDNAVQARRNGIQKLFSSFLALEAETMQGLLYGLKDDPLLQKAWLAQDRERLQEQADPLFQEIRAKHQISHFYFTGPDQTCFLRVHNPPRHGDRIKRFTMAEAAENQKPATGIELGPLGTFTLRVVLPWRINGKLAGFLELGKEIEHLTPKLAESLDADLIFLVDKAFLDQTMWEEGMEMLGRPNDWDAFSQIVVIDSTLAEIPPQVARYLNHSQKAIGNHLDFKISEQNREFRGGSVPLLDAGNTLVGDIVVLQDVTKDIAAMASYSRSLILLSGAIGLAIFLIFFFVIGRLEARLHRSFKELRTHRDHLEDLVILRTTSLEEVNEELQLDIIKRQETAKQLQESEKRFRNLFEHANDAIFIIDLKSNRFLDVNNKATRNLGYNKEEFLQLSLKDIYLPEVAEQNKAVIRELLEKDSTVFEREQLTKDGSLLSVEISSRLIDFQGKKAIISHARDITVQRRAATEYKTILRTALDGFWIVDSQGRFVDVNEAYCALTGYSREELLGGMYIKDIEAEEDREEVPRHMRTVMATGADCFESRHHCRDGKIIDVEVSANYVSMEGGRFYVFIRDISERKRAEEKLRQRNQDLAALYSISSTVNKTLDLQDLFKEIVDSLVHLDLLKTKPDIVLFTLEEDRLQVVYDTRQIKGVVAPCSQGLGLDHCLCGLAARNNEVIISANSHQDSRHTVHYPGMTPHGHIIIPLQASGSLVGVLCLYLPVDAEVSEYNRTLLLAVGEQTGIALDNARLHEQVKSLALHDPLTGLANRRLMDIMLNKSFAKAKRFNRSFALIMADIDYFKNYNDTHGHAAGDRILIEVAAIMIREIREADLIVRYGGEEFLVLLPEADLDLAGLVAERTRKALEKNTGVTISLGVAAFREGCDQVELLKWADDALYHAKRSGRNRVAKSSCTS